MKPPDIAAAALALRAFLEALGAPIEDPELQGTPERVALAFAEELLDGYRVDPSSLLTAALASEEQGLIAVRGLAYASLCPHHLMPSLGVAHIAYVPAGRLVGVGTLSRLLDAFAHRLVLQETLGRQLVEALVSDLGALSAGVVLEARHACLAARGERQDAAVVVTHSFAGEWSSSAAARAEFFTSLGAGALR